MHRVSNWWTGGPKECCPQGTVCDTCDTDEWTPQQRWWHLLMVSQFKYRRVKEWLSWYLPFTPRYLHIYIRSGQVISFHRTFEQAVTAMLNDTEHGGITELRTEVVR